MEYCSMFVNLFSNFFCFYGDLSKKTQPNYVQIPAFVAKIIIVLLLFSQKFVLVLIFLFATNPYLADLSRSSDIIFKVIVSACEFYFYNYIPKFCSCGFYYC